MIPHMDMLIRTYCYVKKKPEKKNLIIRRELDGYVLEHPDFAEKIPDNAQVVLLPAGDQELCRINKEIGIKKGEDRKEGLPFGDFNLALTFAERDLKDNWQIYRARFLKEVNE